MCSVLRCKSWRRSAHRFNLPEDPERRLQWVQFLLEVNEHQVTESSWTDISICREHFTEDCFKNVSPVPGLPQLQCSAVPTIPAVKSEPEEPPVIGTCEEVKTDDDPQNKDLSHPICLSHGENSSEKEVEVTGEDYPKNTDLSETIYVSDESSTEEVVEVKSKDDHKIIDLSETIYVSDEMPLEKEKEVKTTEDPKNNDLSDVIYLSDDESPSEEEEQEDYDNNVNSDDDWSPTEDILLTEGHSSLSEYDGEEEEEEEEKKSPSGGLKRLCTDCGAFYRSVKSHICEHKVKPFSCTICGKRCVTKWSLRNHHRIHEETYQHPCKYCNLNFQTRVDKLKHENSHQNSKNPYKCLHCPETFSSLKKRRIHQSQHGGRQLIKCEVCGLGFYYENQLLRHSLVHTGEKPYKCSVCQQGFKQASHLKSHMRLHTGEKPYKCQHCDKRFNHNVSLKSHIQRDHRSTSGAKSNERQKQNHPADAGISCNSKGSDFEEDDEERQHNTENKVQKITEVAKRGMMTSGRPIGRPKKNKVSNSKTKSQGEKLKTTLSNGEKRVSERSNRRKREIKRRPKSDSDDDFDPETETKKSRCS